MVLNAVSISIRRWVDCRLDNMVQMGSLLHDREQIKISSLTLSKSSSFSDMLSSPDSSSRKGFVGSRGVSGFFCWESKGEKTSHNNKITSMFMPFFFCLPANRHGSKQSTSVGWPHPGPVGQGAAREALSQQSLEIGGPLNSEEQKLDLDLPGTSSHQLG